MAQEEKTFFTYNGWLFCNTLFAPDDLEPGEMKWVNMDHDIAKSCYKISQIVTCNASAVKGTCVVRFSGEVDGFNIQVPFKVMAEIISTRKTGLYDDSEAYEAMISKKQQ